MNQISWFITIYHNFSSKQELINSLEHLKIPQNYEYIYILDELHCNTSFCYSEMNLGFNKFVYEKKHLDGIN